MFVRVVLLRLGESMLRSVEAGYTFTSTFYAALKSFILWYTFLFFTLFFGKQKPLLVWLSMELLCSMMRLGKECQESYNPWSFLCVCSFLLCNRGSIQYYSLTPGDMSRLILSSGRKRPLFSFTNLHLGLFLDHWNNGTYLQDTSFTSTV